MSETGKKIREFVISRFPLAKQGRLDDEQDLLQSGIIDSLGILEVVNYLSEEFSVVVSDEELLPENFSSISKLTSFTERKWQITGASD